MKKNNKVYIGIITGFSNSEKDNGIHFYEANYGLIFNALLGLGYKENELQSGCNFNWNILLESKDFKIAVESKSTQIDYIVFAESVQHARDILQDREIERQEIEGLFSSFNP